uniref:Vacuolar protein-sorting-associated protein 36 n=1 Tax=Strongyloides venezuelensis TaxID=75913 RepID=A0A0K0G493_STRVS
MDRITWYQQGESMEDLLCQAGNVGIYDGDLKQSAFEQGTASLTLQRIIWADSHDPDCRLVLHHSLVNKIDKHHKSMFSKGGKIIVHLDKPPSKLNNGPVQHSTFNSLRLVFKSGGEDEFYKKYMEALSRQTWKRNSSSSSSGGSRSSSNATNHHPSTFNTPNTTTTASSSSRVVGIGGIERRINEHHARTHENISQAFEDMSRLMDQAKEMVAMSKSITEKLRAKKGKDVNDDETIQFKSHLLSLGVADPVTKNTFGNGAKYFEKLAHEICTVLETPIREAGGMIALPEAYCRINRARGTELISPEDLLNACLKLESLNFNVTLHKFDSDVYVLQLKEKSIESTIDETYEIVSKYEGLTPNSLSKQIGISVILAKERLIAAENEGRIVRDDSVEGLAFYTNKFLECIN